MSEVSQLSTTLSLVHYEKMVLIRRFEEMLLTSFRTGEIKGTTHTCIGQEAIAVASMSSVTDDDVVFASHRAHGHFLSYGGSPESLLLEIVGNHAGVSYGLGGSQHLHYKNFYTNGVQGGIVPITVGCALSRKQGKQKGIAVCFLGDGTFGEGVVYEAFNMASLFAVPVLFIVENNQFAQSTPIEMNLAGSIAMRSQAFNIETREVTSNDIKVLLPTFSEAFDYVRSTGKPLCQIVNTYRLGPHSRGDDPRTAEELAPHWENEPLVLAKPHFTETQITQANEAAEKKIASLVQHVKEKLAKPEQFDLDKVLGVDEKLVPEPSVAEDGFYKTTGEAPLVLEHLRENLLQKMQLDADIIILGEDILDPYGGAFKVTKGLSTAFPDRVITTPISEAGIVGVSTGLALSGFKPITEIMFGDFTALICDQVVNQMTKIMRMYGPGAKCPVIIRTPMGGYRGYGPTHSQSLEKIFMGCPGLTIVALSPIHDQNFLWQRMLDLQSPILFVENKTLYGKRMLPEVGGKIGEFHVESSRSYFPTMFMRLDKSVAKADLSILTYGSMLPLAMEAARSLFIEDELIAEVVCFSQIAPLPEADLARVAAGSDKFLTLEEGTKRWGWGAEILAQLTECRKHNRFSAQRCAALNTIIPNSKAGEDKVLPSLEKILAAARQL